MEQTSAIETLNEKNLQQDVLIQNLQNGLQKEILNQKSVDPIPEVRGN